MSNERNLEEASAVILASGNGSRLGEIAQTTPKPLLHDTLARLEYQPKTVLPHFHDTAFYMRRLAHLVSNLPSPKAERLANSTLRAYRELPELDTTRTQLIHGDPRTNNILFKRGTPYAYIDFDTLMYGTIWSDIGDLLRALSGDNTQTVAAFSYEQHS
ncbi:MAG TPA: phosphotransferase [Candidatus Limnocylindria bacterium]|nr:phosphotransferase [Candidatus Limnocylindria bacterium]